MTNVLETKFETRDGTCTLIDCMPLYEGDDGDTVQLHQIVRLVRCEKGTVTLRLECTPRPDYARAKVDTAAGSGNVTWKSQAGDFSFETSVDVEVNGDGVEGTLVMGEGQEALFVFSYHGPGSDPIPDVLTPDQRIDRTVKYWEAKSADLEYDGLWPEHVMRSYLVLHLLTFQPTGGIVAAPTTSLPESIGGIRNWDYRYTWLRDAAFTIDELMSLGHHDDAQSFLEWLAGVCAKFSQDLRIMYRVDATGDLAETELDHLEGYSGSRPVRIGNGAFEQVQHDIYGEVLASAHLLGSSGLPISDAQWGLLRMLANLAESNWRKPDSGIWEIRGGPFHFVHSKVMCWVALDRAALLAEMMGQTGPESQRWMATAKAIKTEVLQRGWNVSKQTFVQHYDTDAIDASVLVLPLVGMLPFDDPRVVSTVRRVQEELADGPYLHRYRVEETDDGLTGGEGAFILCSFWLIQVLARMGNVEEAGHIFGQLLDHANHLGLFAEMIDPRSGTALGNFPQAFTHVGLILAARDCSLA